MGFSWSIKTEEQAKEINKPVELKAGQYKFRVYHSEEFCSGKGNNYVLVKMKVLLNDSGSETFAEDRIVDHPAMFFKRNDFWNSVGHPELLNADFEEYDKKSGLADFEIEEYYSKKHGENRQKLVVKNYVSKTKTSVPVEQKKDELIDDEVPF